MVKNRPTMYVRGFSHYHMYIICSYAFHWGMYLHMYLHTYLAIKFLGMYLHMYLHTYLAIKFLGMYLQMYLHTYLGIKFLGMYPQMYLHTYLGIKSCSWVLWSEQGSGLPDGLFSNQKYKFG
jgi:hypothetical protein